MLIWVAQYLQQFDSFFGVFRYLTLRTMLSILTALFLSLLFGPYLIRLLGKFQIGQHVRDDGPQSHLSKAGTPTMGGMLIVLVIVVTTLLWGELSNPYLWVALLTTCAFAVVGWYDDFLKISRRNSKGLSARAKYLAQSVAALTAAVYLYANAQTASQTALLLPFLKTFTLELGAFYLLTTYLVVVGSSNAVNLTDGLDGLAIMPTVLIAGALIIFAYVTGNIRFSAYLALPFIPGTGELCVFCASIVGAGLGFLWFNTYPAQVFMGDIGALALGAALGIVAVIVRQELVLFVMGGVFVLETVSVILQVASFKLTGRRIFRMAPIHHHFELKGWPEPRVIVRFWIISVILVLTGLTTLKLR